MIIAITAERREGTGKTEKREREERVERGRGIIRLYNDDGPSHCRRRFHCTATISHPLCRRKQTEGWRRTENGYTDWPPAGAAVNILSPSRGGCRRGLLSRSLSHSLIHPLTGSPFRSHPRGAIRPSSSASFSSRPANGLAHPPLRA